MKFEFETPVVEIVEIDAADIITTSNDDFGSETPDEE